MVAELQTSSPLPHWDMTPYFPAPHSREFASEHERLGADLGRIEALYDLHDVRGGSSPLELTDERLGAFEAVLATTNAVLERLRLLSAYVNAFVTTDARDESAGVMASQLQMLSARMRALSSRFDAWVASIGADALVGRSAGAGEHAYPLRKSEPRRCPSDG